MGYWAMEYGKVLIAYIALMYIWPSVVFRKYLATKSRTYRFAFCSTVQVMLVNTVVLLLGLIHLLNRWSMILVFYGIFIGSILWKRKMTGEGLRQIRQVLIGTRGIKLFLLQSVSRIHRLIKQQIKALWRSMKGRRIEYLTLGVVVLYGMIYFSYGTYVDHSYGHRASMEILLSKKRRSSHSLPAAPYLWRMTETPVCSTRWRSSGFVTML